MDRLPLVTTRITPTKEMETRKRVLQPGNSFFVIHNTNIETIGISAINKDAKIVP